MRQAGFANLLRAAIACAALLLIAGLWSAAVVPVHGQSAQPTPGTDWTKHWQRAQGAPPGVTYAGSQACAQCHVEIFNAQQRTGMAQAAMPAELSTLIAKSSGSLAYQDGSYTLRMQRSEQGVAYSATDGHDTLSAPLLWAFGLGKAGQTYLFKRDGQYFESRASYYSSLKALDLTIGHSRVAPSSLGAALGRELPDEEVKKCFSCHTTGAFTDGAFHIEKLHPGIGCENCHGPGSEHLEAMMSQPGKSAGGKNIFNPAMLAPAEINDFCGSCHRSTRDVLLMNIHDVRNIRFQPYRLENSRCYDPSDKRITCIACHDPHRELATDASSYDEKCLSCHAAQGETHTGKAAACPKAAHDCVTCHMPKTELPGAHTAFTDHYIRVVRPGEHYPG